MKIGIDATWLKPEKSGGVEAFFKNVMDGLIKLKDENEYVLFVAKDNAEYLSKYFNDNRIKYVICNTYAFKVKQHLIWQNLFQYNILKKNNIKICFFPVYEMPIYKCRKIKCITTIQDIQAYHYPEFFSKFENIWFRIAWQRVLDVADKVVTTTEYTKQDIMKNFRHKNNIEMIHIPVVLKDNEMEEISKLEKKYNITKKEYYYTVCSMHKHKNLISLIKTLKRIKDKQIDNIPTKLVISGVGGPNKEKLLQEIKEMGIEENIVITNFVSNAERNSLMKNCNVFLFSSIFEGFGIPPVEAMELGAKVITTKCTSLPEVTKEKCYYVEDPFSEDEWIKQIINAQNKNSEIINFEEYKETKIAKKYLQLFYQLAKLEK